MTRPSARVVIGLALLVQAFAAVPPGIAQVDADATAAESVIMRQLDAFRKGDFDTAYTLAAAVIQQTFDRPAFERMVTTGYAEIARSAFAVVAKNEIVPDGRRYVTLRIIGANGNRIEALYEMTREDGQWRISGVVTKPDAGMVSRCEARIEDPRVPEQLLTHLGLPSKWVQADPAHAPPPPLLADTPA